MSESVKYKALQGVYWMIYCVGFVYVTYFLQEKGISASMIGTVIAVCCVISAFLQPFIGSLADKGGALNWKSILIGLLVINLAICAAMIFIDEGMAVVILFASFMTLINCMMPLVNAACFYYLKKNIVIDFGSARACGSIAFAAISVIVGKLTVAFGAPSVVASGIALNIFLLLITLSMPYYGDMSGGDSSRIKSGGRQGTFLSKYPAFVIMMIGLSLVMAFHNCIQLYMLMILENVGGNSDNLGTAIAIAAVMELIVLFNYIRIHKVFGAKKLLLICGVFYCVRGALYLMAGSVEQIYAVQLLQAVTFAIFASASAYYSDETMAPEDKTKGQGLMAAVLTVGNIIGSLQGGFTYDAFGITWMIIISLGICVAGTGLIFVANRK